MESELTIRNNVQLLHLPVPSQEEGDDSNLSMKLMYLYYQIPTIASIIGQPPKRRCKVSTCLIKIHKHSTKIS
jgi:hypothetical protein